MKTNRPVRRLNDYYKSNQGFKTWVKMNEQWFLQNPEVFQQLLRNPNMVNLFMDLLVMNSSRIQKKLGRVKRRRKIQGRQP